MSLTTYGLYGLAVLVAILFVEVIVRTRFLGTASALLTTSNKAVRVMGSKRISDHWKEKAILAYSRHMMGCSLRLALVLAAVGASIYAIGFASQRFADIDLLSYLATWQGIVLATVAAFIYVGLFHRKSGKTKSQNNSTDSATSEYSTSDRLLHRVALSSPAIREMTLDLELAAGGKSTTEKTLEQPQVFVSGLARAGTTILMRSLYASGQFRSLTYRDMPFVLMPNLWRRLAGIGARNKAAQERAHGDGIDVDYDSPEALEEVFWKTMADKQYIHTDHLAPHVPDNETIEQFRDYVDAIIRSGNKPQGQRYLSKNNNNILRLPALQEAFPNATIVIPFRDPVQQALSLRRQHRRFVADDQADPFAGQYMAWLAHYEFGANHRPFCFDEQALQRLSQSDPESLDHWLDLWAHVYENVLNSAPENALFLSYERLCDSQSDTWNTLLERTGLADWPGASEQVFKLSSKDHDESISDELMQRTQAVYEQLLARGI